MSGLANLRGLVIDLDGVLWRGKERLPGVAEFFDFLMAREMRFLIATNNASRTREDFAAQVNAIGGRVSPEQMLTSSVATARYLTHVLPRGAKILPVGEEGLIRALAEAGFTLVERGADAVVAGIDRTLTYDKLRRATLDIRAGAKFIGTNPDKTLPTEEGSVPGAGSILAALETASGVTPTVIGKPARPMFDIALEMLGTPRGQTAMLGDRLETDILGAQQAGLKSILVLTGITTRELLAASDIQPDFVCDDLVALRRTWECDE
jgi:4-nitrophenyl phosphatase